MPKPRYIPYTSKTRKGVTYRLDLFNGRYFCNCPAFGRKRRDECPHTDADRELRRALNMTNETTAVAIRAHGTDLVPEGYEPLELRPPHTRLPSTDEYEMMMRIAQLAVTGANAATKNEERSLPVGVKTPEQAMTIMLAGFELGLPIFASLRRLYMVNGRIELETQALMGLVKAGDPTAHFRFNTYTRDAVSVTLFRQGEEIITVDYTRADAEAAGQLKDIWYRKKDRETNQQITVDKNAYQLRPGERFGGPASGGRHYVLEQGKSVWTQFTRDMLAYSAIKRACRLGAPELTNQVLPPAPEPWPIELEDKRHDRPELANPVSKALMSGELAPAEVMGPDTAPEAAERPEEPQPAQDTARGPAATPATRQRAPRASAAKPDPRLTERIANRLEVLKNGNADQSALTPQQYAALYASVLKASMPEGETRLDFAKMTPEGAAAAWNIVKPEEPPAPPEPEAPEVEEPDADEPDDEEEPVEEQPEEEPRQATLSDADGFA